MIAALHSDPEGLSRSQDPPRDLGAGGEVVATPHETKLALENCRPLKICRVITRLNIGGPSVQATLLSTELGPPAFESVLLTGLEDEREGNYLDLLDPTRRDGLFVETLASLGRTPRPGPDLRTLSELVAVFRRIRPDIVHTHMAKAGTIGRIAARLTGVPIVVHTFHGNVFRGYFSGPVSAAVRKWEVVLARLSDAVVAISPSQAAELRKAGISPRKIRMIPLGIPLERFESLPPKQEARAHFGVPEGSICIGWVARLVPVKDPSLMIRAAAAAAAAAGEPGSLVLLVAGDGPLREEVEREAIALGVEVRFLGWQADLARFYAACDVVALSSRNEGFPVSLIEAIASRRPVAATDVGGVSDLFAEAGQGVLAETNTPDALASAIRTALETPEAQLEVSARRVRDRYGARRLLSDITALYEELAYAKLDRLQRRRRRSSR